MRWHSRNWQRVFENFGSQIISRLIFFTSFFHSCWNPLSLSFPFLFFPFLSFPFLSFPFFGDVRFEAKKKKIIYRPSSTRRCKEGNPTGCVDRVGSRGLGLGKGWGREDEETHQCQTTTKETEGNIQFLSNRLHHKKKSTFFFFFSLEDVIVVQQRVGKGCWLLLLLN